MATTSHYINNVLSISTCLLRAEWKPACPNQNTWSQLMQSNMSSSFLCVLQEFQELLLSVAWCIFYILMCLQTHQYSESISESICVKITYINTVLNNQLLLCVLCWYSFHYKLQWMALMFFMMSKLQFHAFHVFPELEGLQ